MESEHCDLVKRELPEEYCIPPMEEYPELVHELADALRPFIDRIVAFPATTEAH